MPEPRETPTMSAGRELDALIAEKVMGWTRYGAMRRGARCVVLVAKKADCWTFTRSQGDPGTWEDTTEPITEWRDIPHYSTDIAAAFLVVEKLRADGWLFDFDTYTAGMWCVVIEREEAEDLRAGSAVLPSLPEAICRAALKALESEP